jgi:hypothetical protein
MKPFGAFSLSDATGQPVPCWITWLVNQRDWSFVKEWEKQGNDAQSQQVGDSIDYAQTGAKRWRWLGAQHLCVSDTTEAARRIKKDSASEFGFSLALSIKDGRKKQVIGFCYARRLWLNRLCLEFLGAIPPPGITGTGSLLLNAVADIGRTLRVVELWGECTANSQGFYQKTKARFLIAALEDALRHKKNPNYSRDWQLPGAVDDRFIFGRQEITLMSEVLRASEVH